MRKLFTAAALAIAFSVAFMASGAMAAKDTLVMGVSLEPPYLDPTAGAAAAIDEIVYANVMEGLTRIDSTGAVKPALAESWKISSDGLTYTFKLHSGVKFHDGANFSSADVKFTLDRARGKNSVNAQKGLFEVIANVATPSPDTVVVTLKQPTGSFLFNMGGGDAVIVSPKSAKNNKSDPIGTGPFKFKSWSKGNQIVLVRNNDYWGTKVRLKKVTFKFIPDPTAAMAAMLAGDVDAFANFPAPESLAQFKADPRFDVVIGSTEGETILAMNNGRGALKDIRVRRAISHAIDRREIIDGAMFGYGTPIGSHFAPHRQAYVDLTNRYPYDIKKAKKLLAEAGYPNGLKLTLKLPPPTYARRGGEIIASQLKKIGITVEIIPVGWAQWLKQVFRGHDYDLTIVSHTEPMDIGIYARDKYYFNYHGKAIKKVMAELAATVDVKKRNALLGKAQRIIADDAVNGFLFELPKLGVWKKGLKGLWHNSPIQANDLTGVYWQ